MPDAGIVRFPGTRVPSIRRDPCPWETEDSCILQRTQPGQLGANGRTQDRASFPGCQPASSTDARRTGSKRRLPPTMLALWVAGLHAVSAPRGTPR